MGITQADYAKMAIYNGGQVEKVKGKPTRNHMAAAYNDFTAILLKSMVG